MPFTLASNESNALDSLLKSHLYGLIRMGYLLSNILTLLLLQGRTQYVLFCSDCKTIGENYTKKKNDTYLVIV